MITENAVADGARAISGKDFTIYPDPSFRIARAVLEATAPRMLHEAWLEGRNASPESFVANPYPVPTIVEADASSTLEFKAIAAVLELHREKPCTDEEGDPVGGTYCEECKDLDDHSGERVHEIYPCLTVREIRAALAGLSTFTDMRNKIEGMVK